MIEHLYSALMSANGICVRSDSGDGEALRQALYRARREADDASLEALSFHISPTDPGEVWITKKAKPNGAA